MGVLKHVELSFLDFWLDEDVICMDATERGIYISLILLLYSKEGSIKVNAEEGSNAFFEKIGGIANYKRKPKPIKECWESIKSKFKFENGVLTHSRVNEEIEKAKKKYESRVMAASLAGKASIEARMRKKATAATINEIVNRESNLEISQQHNEFTDKIIKLWNKYADKKCDGSEQLSIGVELSRVMLSTSPALTYECIEQAIENYHKARKLRNTKAGNFRLINFLRKISSGDYVYLPQYFDLDHFRDVPLSAAKAVDNSKPKIDFKQVYLQKRNSDNGDE